MSGAERDRIQTFGKLQNGLLEAGEWYLWGPYLSERQWGTVREDYSADGSAWDYLPHDHARSRAYRWGEDGMAGFCDIEQRLCLALALWNGRDPILKERMFGLTGEQGNHGEDVKEYWWYVDAVPSHAWNRWRYHYPQAVYPYDDLVAENGRRTRRDPEYELLDTGVFDDDRYWVVEVDYAKADAHDILMAVRVTNAGPDAEVLHVLPTVWFRNTWSWDSDAPKPRIRARADAGSAPRFQAFEIGHPRFGDLELLAGPAPDGSAPEKVFCENETNAARLFGSPSSTPYPKDGINDRVVHGTPSVNPDLVGTKAAFWYRPSVGPGQTIELRLRLRPVRTGGPVSNGEGADPLGDGFAALCARRQAEADAFYDELHPAGVSDDEAGVMRQAYAGMLWCKQFYHYDVERWLAGDPTQPPPPAGRQQGRNSGWRHLRAFDVMSMPDAWEYPWFAAWDLGFHCVTLARIDPQFAKYQLLLICREWFQSPQGALPAYEWSFGDVNPPVQAWAALEVFRIDGSRDVAFLAQAFSKLIANFTWWMNREDVDGNNLFAGGFMGLDNIGPIDRSHLPAGERMEQSDATGWMAFYALCMAAIASELRISAHVGVDLVVTYLEHYALIRDALDRLGAWDEQDGFFYDQLLTASGRRVPLEVRSMVGVIPLLASVVLDEPVLRRAEAVGKGLRELGYVREADVDALAEAGLLRGEPGDRRLLVSVVGPEQLRRVLARLFDEEEFLSPHGLRALSAVYRHEPYVVDVDGVRGTVDYEPAESTTAMFGGNSNWRGPVWLPVNALVVSALDHLGVFFGDDFQIEYPTRSGVSMSLSAIAEDLRRRLVSLFLPGPDGRRPCYGAVERLQRDPAWSDRVLFFEYFHGDNGAGLGASHQTGWTGFVAELISRRRE